MLYAVLGFLGGCEFDTALGNELHLLDEVGLTGEHFAEGCLVTIVAIYIGVVERGDAFVEGCINELFDSLGGDRIPAPCAGDYA